MRNKVEIVQIEVKGELVDAKECNKCNTIKPLVEFHKLKNGVGGRKSECKLCRSVKKNKYNLEIIKKEFEIRGYKLLEGEYVDTRTKMKYVCNKHLEHVQQTNWNTLQRGSGCKYCGIEKRLKSRMMSYENVKTFIEIDSNSGAKLLSNKYIHNRDKLELQCKCGNKFEVSFRDFKSSNVRQCKSCSGTKRMTITEVRNFIEKEGYKLLSSEYKNVRTKLQLICSNGHYWDTSFSHFKNGKRCSKCHFDKLSKTFRLSYDIVKQYFEDKNCILLSDTYTNNHEKLKYICECGNKSEITFNNFRHGQRCSKCTANLSKGEECISDHLNFLGFNTIKQYEENECKNKRNLPFDIALIDNKIKNILIEYDGEQHFTSIEHFGSDEGFEYRKHNDKIKNRYCIDNNIPLIRIPYWEFNNIEYILENVLKHYNLIESDNTYDKDIVYKYLVDEHWDHDIYLKWNDKDNRDLPMKQIHIMN